MNSGVAWCSYSVVVYAGICKQDTVQYVLIDLIGTINTLYVKKTVAKEYLTHICTRLLCI